MWTEIIRVFVVLAVICFLFWLFAAPEKKHQDWICVVEWVQAGVNMGGWIWTVYLIDNGKLHEKYLAQGACGTKLGVRWEVWRLCFKHGLKYKPNISGTIE